jgi:silicon transporter
MVQYSTIDYIKMAYSVCLVIFSVVIVTALIFERDTKISSDVHPAVALVVMWTGIIWMSMVEGGQCSMVGLPPINRELYKESHPITYQITSLGHKGDNLDRYLMGRQFMVIFINFTINLCGAPLQGAEVLGLPSWVQSIFLGSGIAMILTVVNIGQLTAQVNASHCMLDYIDTHFMTFTLYMTFIIEKTGVMHSCYLIRDMFFWAAKKSPPTNEPPRTAVQSFFHWGRVIFSLGVLAFALAVTIAALFQGKTTMWEGVPNGVAVVLFFVLTMVVGTLEGMQIAFFTIAKYPASERGSHPFALRVCDCLFRGEGRNLPGFMVGRQMTVTLCFFVIARVTTLNVVIGTGENIFGVSDPVQKFFNMGFLGAIITTILGSITWQFVALCFPIQFLSNPFVFLLLKCALFLEATGICSASWFFGILHKKVAGFQLDEVYVGTAEERAMRGMADDKSVTSEKIHLGTHGLVEDLPKSFLAEFAEVPNFTQARSKILANISQLREGIKLAESDEERQAFKVGLELEIKALTKLNSEQANQESKSDSSPTDVETNDQYQDM